MRVGAWSGSAIFALMWIHVFSVDKSNFKTCDQSSFCKRNRALQPGQSLYDVLPESISIEETSCRMDVVNKRTGAVLGAEIFALQGNMFRLKIDEKNPIRPRYKVTGSLVGEPAQQKCQVQRTSDGLEITSSTSRALVTLSPFRIEFLTNNEIAAVFNSRGLFNFEPFQVRQSPPGYLERMWYPFQTALDSMLCLFRSSSVAVEPARVEEVSESQVGGETSTFDTQSGQSVETSREATPTPTPDETKQVEQPDTWEESFKGHMDSRPYGPSSIGMDISFPGVEHVYGIPEHADSFALKTTTGGEPYRLFNLDVFEYELRNPMALYGSIPLMLAHNWSKTVAIFWHNAAETWIDIASATANKSMLGKLMSYFKSGEEVPQVDTHWMSESGIVDVFVLLGPQPRDVFKQYSTLTGTTPIPPLFSIAYHQCRWNYNDEPDVENVDSGFDNYDIPYDVLWLDIEHTDGKKYLTWDLAKFPNPEAMQNKLAVKGRKMVTIVDPHIKRESGYHVHEEADANNYYIKKADGSLAYEGWCWPGTSSWVDFADPAIRKWWAESLAFDKYKGSTPNLFIWNDMNEPSVFNGPEVSVHKDTRHYGDWENRDLHNIYGMFVHQATSEGLVLRSAQKERSFVLSRAFFAGSQRFGAVWTGDNAAGWDHLQVSIPMILSIGVAGLPFVGADIGGFFKNPDADLLVRWYQVGAFYPFMRAHAHLDTRRREPWLFEADKMALIRDAIRTRYELLPLWYTAFYEHYQSGMPVARPLWVEFPRDRNTYAVEDQFMLGGSLLIRPVLEQYATSVQLYLPGNNAVWYDVKDYTTYAGAKRYTVDAPLGKIPVFQRGGTIVSRKMRIRRSSAAMANDPYTLIVALDAQGAAKGQLYVDDGHSLDYLSGAYLLREFKYSGGVLTASTAQTSGNYTTKSWLEKVVVVGLPNTPKTVKITSSTGTQDLLFTYTSSQHVLTIRKPGVNIALDFTISIS
eukprot:Em0019g143a